MNKRKLKKTAIISLGILLFLTIIALGSSGKKTASSDAKKDEGAYSSSLPSPPVDSHSQENAYSRPASQDSVGPPEASAGYAAYEDMQEPPASADYTMPAETDPPASGLMEVHFMDVGQGDATLVTCGGESMLIDAGDDSRGTAVQYYLKQHGVDSLKYLVLTHPDADHIGGADVVVTKFDIGTVFESYYKKPSYHKASEDLAKALSYKYMSPVVPSVGSSYDLGSARFTFVGPTGYSDEPNNASLALVLQYGQIRFLFTGDAESEEESAILESGYDISADVYKAGHHGSSSSSNGFFLRAVNSSYAVISCGTNDYGHPHSETLQRLANAGAAIFRTDQSGNIVASTDGTTISWNAVQSEPGLYSGDSYEDNSYDSSTYQNNPFESTGATTQNEAPSSVPEKKWYYVVTTAGYFHQAPCDKIRDGENPQTHYWLEATRDELIAMNLKPCKYCSP